MIGEEVFSSPFKILVYLTKVEDWRKAKEISLRTQLAKQTIYEKIVLLKKMCLVKEKNLNKRDKVYTVTTHGLIIGKHLLKVQDEIIEIIRTKKI